MKKLALSILVLSISVSQISPMIVHAYTEDSNVAQVAYNVESNYITRDPVYDLNDKSVNRAESAHFQIIWGNNDTTGTINRQLVEGNLQNLESIRSFYIDVLGMKDPCTSMNNSLSGNYKTNLYIAATGLSKIQDDWAYMSVDKDSFGYMVLAPGALRADPPSWVVPHEYAHVVTYHQGGMTPNGWYEAMANWFRNQYLGSSYYKFDSTTYGPDADFFAPFIKNANMYFPHVNNWYDAWPILLYVTENPDNINGLGLDLMHKLLEDNSNTTMFEKLERLSGTSIKELLGGFSRRMATLDFKMHDRYVRYMNDLLAEDSSNYSKVYTTLAQTNDGYLQVPNDKAPMQGGYNIIPLDVDLNSSNVSIDFKPENVNGSDFRVSIVAETNSGQTRYSSTWSNGTNSLKLQGDEKKLYLVVCATPDEMKDLDVFDTAATSATKYPYKIKVSTNTITDTPVEVKNSTLNTTSVTFDKGNDSLNDDVIRVFVNLNGNELKSIKNLNNTLAANKDYTLIKETSYGPVIELSKDYLSKLPEGTSTLTLSFSSGNDAYLPITIKNTNVTEKPSDTPISSADFDIQVNCGSEITTNTLNGNINIKNNSNTNYDLSKFKVRYYYTKDGDADQNIWLDTSAIKYTSDPWYVSANGCTNSAIKNLSRSTSTADCFTEFTFDDNSIVLNNSATLQLSFRIAKNDWSNFNQSNDYSYNSPQKVVVYYDGKVINGMEP